MHLWDYDKKKLSGKRGKLLLLERMINYGIYAGDRTKIALSDVKKNWEKLNLEPKRRRLFKFLIWGK